MRDWIWSAFGYQVTPKDPAFFSRFPDGRHLFHVAGRAKTLAEIAKFSTHDAEVYPAYEAHLERISQVVEGTAAGYASAVSAERARRLHRVSEAGGTDARSERGGDSGAGQRSSRRARRIFWTSGSNREEVKVTLATDGVIGANGGPRSPGTAYILLHHCMGGVAGHRGLWGFVRGGMGAVSEAIAASARAKGAEIRTNAASRGCWCATGARCGVALDGRRGDRGRSGDLEPRSKADVSEAGGGEGLAAGVSSLRSGTFGLKAQVAKINLALNGLPEFTAYPGCARAASSRDHAYLPQHRIRGAGVG